MPLPQGIDAEKQDYEELIETVFKSEIKNLNTAGIKGVNLLS
jgi:hypothetical protein